MVDNAQKTPIQFALHRFVEDKISNAQQAVGKNIPATVVSVDPTGTIVTVQFEIVSDLFTLPQVQCSLATDEFTRPPITKGAKGYVVSSDYFMGGMTGLGTGNATFDKQSNLSMLVFHPCGNTEYAKLYDQDRYVTFGPKGVIIQNADSSMIVNFGPIKDGTGPKNVVQILTLVSASSDSDAAGKGIPINGLYQTSGAVKVRIT